MLYAKHAKHANGRMAGLTELCQEHAEKAMDEAKVYGSPLPSNGKQCEQCLKTKRSK